MAATKVARLDRKKKDKFLKDVSDSLRRISEEEKSVGEAEDGTEVEVEAMEQQRTAVTTVKQPLWDRLN